MAYSPYFSGSVNQGDPNINTKGWFVKLTDGTNDLVVDTVHGDGESNTENHLDMAAKGMYFNGSTWDRVRGNTSGSLVMGVVEHDAVDFGFPLKIGFKAKNALPTPVANDDRVNGISDLWGRQLVSHIDPAMQVYKVVNVTTTQTGTDVWSPAAGKKIAVTYLQISSYATTAARVILWFGDNADTTYTAGTDQVLWAGSFSPSSTAKPMMVVTFPTPVFCVTADRELHLTTDGNISLDITVYGYEW